MKAFINRRTIIIFSTALLMAIIAIVSVNVFNSPGPVTGFANTVTRPVRAVATVVARTFGTIFAANYEYEQLVIRNNELLKRIAEMEIDYRDSQLLAEENEQLRRALDFRERHGGYSYDWANFDGWGGDNWSSTFLIDKGYADGIARGMGVTTEEGALIGQIYEVGAESSTVITILDTKFSAAVYVGRTDTDDDVSSSAVAKGDFSYMGRGMLLLDNIDENIIVRRGDMVVTSGHGNVFPAGLMVGMIDDVIRHESGIGRYAPITPLVNFNSISTVFIITGFDRDADSSASDTGDTE